VLLPQTSLQNATRVIESLPGGIAMGRVRDASGEPLRKITASAGVGTYRGNESAEEFVARVDTALYESKRRGRNRVTVAD